MPLQIDNKKVIPAPLVTIQKRIEFADDGSPLNTLYNITLQGTMLPQRGSPRSNGWWTGAGDPPDESFSDDNDKFNSILQKQDFLREGFSASGYKLSYSPPGLTPVECYPKLTNINFTNGTWVIKCDYTIELEARTINKVGTADDEIFYGSGYLGLNLKRVSDDFSIREKDDGSDIMEVTRTISAVADYRYSDNGPNSPWENARTWVTYRKINFPFTSGLISIGSGISGQSYNKIEQESINKLAGSYALTQTFLFHSQNYIDNRKITKTDTPVRLGDGGPSIRNISIAGSITGLDPNNIPVNKFNNASGYWNSITGTLAGTVGAVGRAISSTTVEDRTNGLIDYNVEYINNSGSTYTHIYDVNSIFTGDYPVVSINGTIEGITPDSLYHGSGADYTKFDNALEGWIVVSGTLKTLAFAHPELTPSGSLFSNTPYGRNISFNKPNGTISYNYTFLYTSGSSINYQHTYNIDISADNAPNSTIGGIFNNITVNGQIIGIDTSGPSSKIENAKTAWNTIKSTIFSTANNEFSLIGTNIPILNSGFIRRTISLDNKAGILSYSSVFNNWPFPTDSKVAVEDVSVEDVSPADIFAIQIIPGRSAGPIIQNLDTHSEYRRNINITLTMFPKIASPYYWTYSDKSTPSNIASGILSGLLPPGIRTSGYWFAGNSETWTPKAGLFTQTVNIVY
jgi:hypothetical protein